MTTPQTIQPSPAASTTNAPILMTREGELALREELARLREEVEVQLPQRLRQAPFVPAWNIGAKLAQRQDKRAFR